MPEDSRDGASGESTSDSLPPALRLHQLEGLYRVLRYGGFARAVQAVQGSVTEPALHQQVRKLEATLGVELAKVGPGRRLVPTPEGRRLYGFVAPFFERLPGEVRAIASGAGEWVVGSEPLYVADLVAPACAKIAAAEQAVELDVQLLERDVVDLVHGIERSRIDLAVVGRPEVVPTEVEFRSLGRLGVLLLVPDRHPWAKRRKLEQADLFREADGGLACLRYERGSEARRHTDRIARELSIPLRGVGEATSASALRALVRSGVGPAFVPALDEKRPRRRHAKDGVIEFDLRPAFEGAFELPEYGMLVHRDASQHPRVDDFFSALAGRLV